VLGIHKWFRSYLHQLGELAHIYQSAKYANNLGKKKNRRISIQWSWANISSNRKRTWEWGIRFVNMHSSIVWRITNEISVDRLRMLSSITNQNTPTVYCNIDLKCRIYCDSWSQSKILATTKTHLKHKPTICTTENGIFTGNLGTLQWQTQKIQRAVSEITKMSTSSYLDCPLANNSFKISYNNQFQNSKKRHSQARDFQKIKKKKNSVPVTLRFSPPISCTEISHAVLTPHLKCTSLQRHFY